MDTHIKEFFSQQGAFHEVIALHEIPYLEWNDITKKVPTLPKGWFELSHLNKQDRVDFLRDFWLTRFPYHVGITESLMKFFAQLDDIGIYATQKNDHDSFDVNLVYSISNNRGFYRGSVPATEEDIVEVKKLFPDYILPADYIEFLKIHNGFWKSIDCTGIISTMKMKDTFEKFRGLISSNGILLTNHGSIVNPNSLIPFYESFGMPYFQCFWGEWHPEDEMGNVYYSASSNTISDARASVENMAFKTFTDWLIFYLEQIN